MCAAILEIIMNQNEMSGSKTQNVMLEPVSNPELIIKLLFK